MLVPEIALTPAVAALFRGAFGERVAIQHSGLSDGERHDQWQRIRRGDVDVVVGTRSAVFAPLDALGPRSSSTRSTTRSYKQEESPRYNGRDVAIVRGQRAGALVVLGSATPSMETLPQRASAGGTSCVVLERRVLDRPLADVTRRRHARGVRGGGPGRRPEPRAARGASRRGSTRRRAGAGAAEPPRLRDRGVLPAVRAARSTARTAASRSSCTARATARRARCHYCNYSARVPTACPLCAAPYLEQAGFGTERVEAEVASAVPGARVARLDRDAIRRAGRARRRCSRGSRAGEIDVLVGTQMIAKGHDFPRVTLVGVVSADVGLGLADFRAAERTFQLLTQVAGRAGRGERAGRGDRPDALSRTTTASSSRAARTTAAFYERGARVPAGDALSAARRARQRRRPRRGRSTTRWTMRRDLVRAAARAAPDGGFAVLGPGAGAARQAARRVPRAVLHQGHATARAMREALQRRSPRVPSCAPRRRRRRSAVDALKLQSSR